MGLLALIGRAAWAESTEVEFGKLKSKTPDAWKAEKLTSKLRTYQFRVPKAEGDEKNAEVVVFFFGPGGGGGIEDNLKRWKKMFLPPEGKTIDQASKLDLFKVGAAEVTYLDIQGTYLARNPADPNAKEQKNPGYRMLSVVFECDNGPYFIRMTGPAKTVEKNKKGFDDWIKNFKSTTQAPGRGTPNPGVFFC